MATKGSRLYRENELKRIQETYRREILAAIHVLGANGADFGWLTVNLERGERAGRALSQIKRRIERSGLPLLQYVGLRLHRNRFGRLHPHMHLIIKAAEGTPTYAVIKEALEVVRKRGPNGPRPDRAVQFEPCDVNAGAMQTLGNYLGDNITDHRDVPLIDDETRKEIKKLLAPVAPAAAIVDTAAVSAADPSPSTAPDEELLSPPVQPHIPASVGAIPEPMRDHGRPGREAASPFTTTAPPGIDHQLQTGPSSNPAHPSAIAIVEPLGANHATTADTVVPDLVESPGAWSVSPAAHPASPEAVASASRPAPRSGRYTLGEALREPVVEKKVKEWGASIRASYPQIADDELFDRILKTLVLTDGLRISEASVLEHRSSEDLHKFWKAGQA